MKTEPSINLHYQHAVVSNQVVVELVETSYSWLGVFLGEGAPKLSPEPIAVGYGNALLNFTCMSVSSIERLDTTFRNFLLKILAKFVFFFSVFLPKGTFLKLN